MASNGYLAASKAGSNEFKRFINNTEQCKGIVSTSQVLSTLDKDILAKYEKKYGIRFDHESKPYLVLIDCIIGELKTGSSDLYHEFLWAMIKIDVLSLSEILDRCDFACLTLNANLVHLIKELDITCISKAIRQSLNDSELDIIDAKFYTREKTSSLIEIIQLRLDDRRHDLFDRFMDILAGLDPQSFKVLAGRNPTVNEAEFCIKVEISDLKKRIIEVGHQTDKKKDVRIDLDKDYVKLRVSRKVKNIDHPMKYQATLTKSDLDIEDIMKRHENRGKLCLVKGRCGIGKTTMAQHLCRRWAINECLEKFSFIFHINVRRLNIFKMEQSMHEILTKHSLYPNSLPLNWLRHWSKLILINIDGLDELGHFSDKMDYARGIRDIYEKATPEELLVNLMKRNLLPEATVICTSRPFETLNTLQSDINLEIMGLTKEGIFEFIERNVPSEDQIKVKSHLQANPILMSVCSITFYASMLSRILVREQEISAGDIDTYSRLTATLIKSYPLRQSTEYVQQSQCSKSFPVLAEIALQNSEKDNGLTNICIDLEEAICQVKSAFPEIAIKNAQKNGLVQITEVHVFSESKRILEFPHLSVQEFFAALQFLKLSKTSQDNVQGKLSNLLEIGSLNMYPLFIFGLAMDTFSNNMNHIKKFTIDPNGIPDGTRESITKCFASLVSNIRSPHQHLNVCQIAYEAQNKQLANIVKEKYQSEHKTLAIEGIPLNALDIKALVFVTGSSNLQEVKLTQTNLDCYSVGILVQSLKGNQQLKTLDLSYNQIRKDGLSAISQLLEAIMGLEELSLNGNSITSTSLKMLLPGLEKERTRIAFSIAENNIRDEGAKDLALALMNTKDLTALNVSHNSIGLKGMDALQILVKKSVFLTRLECDGNAAGDQLMEILLDESRHTSRLTHLSLNDTLVTNQGADILAINIPKLTKLDFISLRGCQIGTNGAKNVIGQLKEKNTQVDLRDNQIDINEMDKNDNVKLAGNVQGSKRLSKISYDISQGKEFDILDLSNCKIKDSNIAFLTRRKESHR